MAEPQKKEKENRRKFHLNFSRVPATDKMFFARYLALMLRAGIPITKSLEFLYAQIDNRRLKAGIFSMIKDITAGIAVSDSMAKFPDIFDELFVNMVRSGESAGNLEEVLDIVAEEIKKSVALRSKVIGALIYPSIIVTAMIIVSIFIVFFVFPRIIQLYESLNVQVPLLTRIMMDTVRFLTANARNIILIAVVLAVAVLVSLRTKAGKRFFDRLMLKLPILKNIIRKINIVQFSRTLSSLLKSGLPTPQALEITSRTFRNVFYRESAVNMALGVRQGKRLSEIIANAPESIYLPIVSQMVLVGEETGTLTEILKQLAEFFEEEVDNILENLTKIIEPILMIAIGIVVGFIAIATVMLIYSALQGVS